MTKRHEHNGVFFNYKGAKKWGFSARQDGFQYQLITPCDGFSKATKMAAIISASLVRSYKKTGKLILDGLGRVHLGNIG